MSAEDYDKEVDAQIQALKESGWGTKDIA